MPTEQTGSARASAPPLALPIQMTLHDTDDAEAAFDLSSPRPGVVEPGTPPAIRLTGIHQPVMITIRLVGDYVDASGARFPANPRDAAWFGRGTALPPAPGTAGDMFRPIAVSRDGRELTFLAVNPGDGGRYRVRLHFGSTLSAAARSGGPIIIND